MEKALTREEMRELDRKTIEEYKIPGIILMEMPEGMWQKKS